MTQKQHDLVSSSYCCRECCVLTAGFDTEQNVLVGVQVVVEDKQHRELGKDKAELKKRRGEGQQSNQCVCFFWNKAVVACTTKTKPTVRQTYI